MNQFSFSFSRESIKKYLHYPYPDRAVMDHCVCEATDPTEIRNRRCSCGHTQTLQVCPDTDSVNPLLHDGSVIVKLKYKPLFKTY